jgi:hypothetical protein
MHAFCCYNIHKMRIDISCIVLYTPPSIYKSGSVHVFVVQKWYAYFPPDDMRNMCCTSSQGVLVQAHLNVDVVEIKYIAVPVWQ